MSKIDHPTKVKDQKTLGDYVKNLVNAVTKKKK